MHCHHEKTIVIDDRVAFVGGIDLTSEAGDRYDTSDHPPARRSAGTTSAPASKGPPSPMSPSTSACAGTKSPAKSSAPAAPTAATGRRDRAPDRPHGSRADLQGESATASSASSRPTSARFGQRSGSSTSRTSSSGRRRSPPSSIDKLAHPPTPRLPARPPATREAEQRRRRHPRRPRRADRSRRRRGPPGRLHPLRPRRTIHDQIYVHAKIGIVDDTWLTLGSANLNEHSLFNDTEMNIVTHDPELATQTRRRLWAEHLELPLDHYPPTPPKPSTATGNRSAPNNSNAATTASHSPTDSPAYHISPNDPDASSARSTDSSSTAEPAHTRLRIGSCPMSVIPPGVAAVFVVIALALVPWTLYLAVSLPSKKKQHKG